MQPTVTPPPAMPISSEQMNAIVQVWIDLIMPTHKPKVYAVKAGTENKKQIFRIEFAPPETTSAAPPTTRDDAAPPPDRVAEDRPADAAAAGPAPAHSGPNRHKAR